MKLLKTISIISMCALVLNGCSTTSRKSGEEAYGAEGAAGAGGAKVGRYGQGGKDGMYGAGGRYGRGGAGEYGAADEAAFNDPSSPLSKRVIYFMYDSYDVLPEYRPIVSAHANYLASHPAQNVMLEGHADERGSPEYNIALSEQRAKAVQRMMQMQGVAGGQVQVVGFGEEKPAVDGHDESFWQQNRRVEIFYSGH
jgi:peptidoglycan-associated lipoprotein